MTYRLEPERPLRTVSPNPDSAPPRDAPQIAGLRPPRPIPVIAAHVGSKLSTSGDTASPHRRSCAEVVARLRTRTASLELPVPPPGAWPRCPIRGDLLQRTLGALLRHSVDLARSLAAVEHSSACAPPFECSPPSGASFRERSSRLSWPAGGRPLCARPVRLAGGSRPKPTGPLLRFSPLSVSSWEDPACRLSRCFGVRYPLRSSPPVPPLFLFRRTSRSGTTLTVPHTPPVPLRGRCASSEGLDVQPPPTPARSGERCAHHGRMLLTAGRVPT